MYPLLAVILSACCLRIVSSSILVDRVCVENSTECYALYKDENSEVRWGVASRSCRVMGQSLASIPDEDTQQLMTQFSQSNPEGTAWLSGRTDSVGDWIVLNQDKELFTVPIEGVNDTTKASCVLQLDPSKRDNFTFVAVDLYSSTGRRALCQYSLQNYSECTKGYNISNVCYKVSEDVFTSMDLASTFCSNLVNDANTKSELSYLNINSQTVINPIWYNNKVVSPTNSEDNQMWIGVRRKYEWTWTAPDTTPFTYDKWGVNETSVDEPSMCLTLNLKADSTWMSTRCNSTSPYYICTAEPELPTTETQTTTTTTTTTTKVNNVAVSDLPQTTDDTNGFQLVLIIVFSVGGFLFIVGILVAVYISSLGGKDSDTSSYDDSEQSDSNLNVYTHPEGVKDLIGSTKSQRTPSDRQAVIRKSKVKSHHEQVRDIFINPQVMERPPVTGANDLETGEKAQRFSNSTPARDRTEVYSVNRSQFTGATMPAPGNQTYQNITSFQSLPPQPARGNADETAPALPPKRMTVLRDTEVPRATALTGDPPLNPLPPIPLPPTPPSERSQSPSAPNIASGDNSFSENPISSGMGEVRAMSNTLEGIDLARGNMLY